MDGETLDLSAFSFEDRREAAHPGLETGPAADPPGPEPEAQSFLPPLIDMPSEMPTTALVSALATQIEAEESKQYRKGTHDDPVPRYTDPRRMIDFINQTRRKPIERIETDIVNDSMPLMLWKLREYALRGEYTEARAVEIWLNWAAKVQSRPKQQKKDPNVASGALFDARLTKGQVIETKPVAEKKSTTAGGKNLFGQAGKFIGREKKPPKPKNP